MGRALSRLLGTALACAVSLAAATGYEMKSYVTVNGRTQESLAWCDAPGAVLALGDLFKYGPNEDGPARTDLYRWPKTRAGLGSLSRQPVTLGLADAGAGQVYTPLRSAAGKALGVLHTSNIENVQDPAYRMTHINEFKLGTQGFRCRYVPQAAFMGVTARRTVIVWEETCPEPLFCKATYATRNLDGSAGVFLRGGEKGYTTTRTQANQVTDFQRSYSWQTPDGFTYNVEISAAGGTVKVGRDGKTLTTESFLAYSISLPRK